MTSVSRVEPYSFGSGGVLVLVGGPVFKTGEAGIPGLAGSIPVRLRRAPVPRIGTVPGSPQDPRRRVPRTDTVLADPAVEAAVARLGRTRVRAEVTAAQQAVRDGDVAPADVAARVLARLPAGPASLRPVLNATGAVLHTNLGRAALSTAAVAAVVAAAGPTDVEYDLATGTRARRGRGALAALRAAVPAAGDVLVVNNGAAALLLAVTALCARPRREVVWSRGELVEIGDGFRLPDLVTSGGARIREVGTTNRTTVADVTAAVGPRTGCVLRVHPSNFRVTGFTAGPGTRELAAALPPEVPLVVDTGSGLLTPEPLLPDEPDVSTALADGAALVTASADKLLGGPQAGLVFGRADLVERLRRHPMARAVRVDKLTLAALEATVAGPVPPTGRALHAGADELFRRCEAVTARLHAAGVDAEVVASPGVVGGGGAPGVELPGWAVGLPAGLARPLRTGQVPVVGRVAGDRLLLDLRAVEPAADSALAGAVLSAAGVGSA